MFKEIVVNSEVVVHFKPLGVGDVFREETIAHVWVSKQGNLGAWEIFFVLLPKSLHMLFCINNLTFFASSNKPDEPALEDND